jgi:hypothetical protein
MARINTRAQFKQYVLTKLGAPILDLVLQTSTIDECGGTTGTTGSSATATTGSTGYTISQGCSTFADSVMTQLDLAVDDALDYFHFQASDLGSEKAMLYITMVDQQVYYEVPECIISLDQDTGRGTTFRFDSEEAGEAVGLFSLQSQFGPRGVFSYLGAGSTDTLLTYDIAQQYNSLVNLRYTTKFITEFLPQEHKILLLPTPDAHDNGHKIMFFVNIKVPDEKCFNNLWVQRYATALTMVQIGRNMSMFTGMQLPGGGDFNSLFYWDNGKEMQEKLEEEMASGKWGNAPTGSGFFTG